MEKHASPPTNGTELLPVDDIGFRVLVDSVRDYAIFLLTPDGTVASWNAGAERIKGYRAEEIIGKNFRLFYEPEDVAAGRPDMELITARETGRYEEEWWRVRKDGSRFRAHVTVTALYDPQGRLTGYAKVTKDVTARWHAEQALRRSEERFRILVEQISDYSIFMLDAGGKISTWNAGAQRIKGYRQEEVLGHSLAIFYTPEDRAGGRPVRLLKQAETEGIAHDIGWRVRKDGSRFWADVTITALHDAAGGLYGFAKVVRDLTERVEAEEQAKAYEAAREAVRLRDEFLSIAAHELRTPLTATQLQLQGLRLHARRDPAKWDPQRIVAGLEMALQSGERLSELVESLLDVARIATGRIRLSLSEFDLVEATHDAVSRLSALTDQAGCRVVVRAQGPMRGRWDRLRIEQALMNLISNACKYAPRTEIEVGVEQAGERVRLWVRDHGPGIAPEHVERIFGRFERAVPAANFGGLGLGLYVTSQIAETHGGSVSVESRLGEGSTFFLDLPLATPWPEPDPASVLPATAPD